MNAEVYHPNDDSKSPKSSRVFGGLVNVGDEDLAAIIRPLEKQITAGIFASAGDWLHGPSGMGGNGPVGIFIRNHAAKAGIKNANALITGADLVLRKIGPFYEVAGEGWQTIRDYFDANRAFAKEIAPVLHAQHQGDDFRGLLSAASRNNEVIQIQRKKIKNDWMGRVMRGASSLPSTLYDFMLANVRSSTPGENLSGLQSSKAYQKGVSIFEGIRDNMGPRQAGAEVVRQLGNFIDRKAQKAETKREQAQTAYGMIKFLAENVEQEPGQERVPAMNDHGRIPLKRYIKDVFQCHQRNMGEKELGQRTLEKLDYACEKIAEEIQNGQLNPLALVALVGERAIVRPGGKQIAPRKEIDEAIAKQKARLPVHYAVDAEQYIEESILNKEDVKHLLDTLKGENRDFFMVCLPQEVVEQAGVTAKDYTEAKQRTHESFARFLHEAVMDMSTLTDKQLRDVGFKDEQIDTLREVAAEVKGKPVRSVLASVSTHGEFAKGIEFIVAGNVDYWRSLANSEFKAGDLFKKAKEEKKAAAKPGMTGEEEAPARTEEDEERHERRASHRRRTTRARHDDMEENDLSADGEEFDQERSARPGLRGLAEHAHLGRLAAERDQGREWAS